MPNSTDLTHIAFTDIDAVILAGGMARRMGGDDKGLIILDDKPMILHTIERLSPQVGRIWINANRNLEQYAQFGYQVISDTEQGFLGPLAGMLTALSHSHAALLLVVPCDSPQLPLDLTQRMCTPCNYKVRMLWLPVMA